MTTGAPWGDLYRGTEPIRCRGPVHFYSARRADTGALQVLVTTPRLAAPEACALVSEVSRAHRLAAGPHVPGVADERLDGPAPWVALDCDAIADFEQIADVLRHSGERLHYEQASVVGMTIMETLERTHRIRDPATSNPVCLGSLAPSNLLYSASGEMWIVGFGTGALSGASIAPDVAAGYAATPGADVFALVMFLRSNLDLVRLPSTMLRVFAGRVRASDAKALLVFASANLRILGGPPRHRPNMEQALRHMRQLWRLLGIEPDVEGFSKFVQRALAGDPERLADSAAQPPTPRILVAPEGEWLETPNGMRHAFGTRRPLRRLLLALADARTRRPGEPLTVDALLQAGWPGENPLPEAGTNRVYVAMSTLRKVGLGAALQRWDGGYRLDPGIPCAFVGR